MRQRMLYIGERDAPEFREAAKWLEAHTESTFLARMDRQQILARDPDCVIVAQSRPATFDSTLVESIHRLVPLAATVALLGPWCEGETRTGKPWPGFVRVYWHQWRPRFETMFGAGQRSSPLRLPRTASDVEVLMAPSIPINPPGPDNTNSRLVWLECDPRQKNMLAELVAGFGLTARTCDDPFESKAASGTIATDDRSMNGTSVLWIDAHPRVGASRAAMLIERHRPAATVVTVDFPRPQDIEAWRKAGATMVLARPWLLDDLAWCLHHAGEVESRLSPRFAA